jgi:hypothetical protein
MMNVEQRFDQADGAGSRTLRHAAICSHLSRKIAAMIEGMHGALATYPTRGGAASCIHLHWHRLEVSFATGRRSSIEPT